MPNMDFLPLGNNAVPETAAPENPPQVGIHTDDFAESEAQRVDYALPAGFGGRSLETV
jgi:hypothetical protein